tara:strand:+ start:1219 stop:1527 length:309 start_codon:yes stop_codon:yes gene_type:complete
MKDPQMKEFLTKKEFRIFANDRMLNSKVKRIISFNKKGILFTAKISGIMAHNFSYGYIQSVSILNKETTYVIRYRDFKFILNEVNFFRRFPKDAKKLKVTII